MTAQEIVDAIHTRRELDLVLVEAGPRLIGDFLAEHVLPELFLTDAPQIAGRARSLERPGFVVDKLFAPQDPLWGELTEVRRAQRHLFLRYAFR